MTRSSLGSSQAARSSSSAVYRPENQGDAPDAASRGRTERLLLDAKSAATLRHKLALMDITAQHIAGHRSHFNPDQPRVPAGNPDGGQWTSAGGGTGSRLAAADRPRLGPRSAIAIAVEIAKQVIKAYRWVTRTMACSCSIENGVAVARILVTPRETSLDSKIWRGPTRQSHADWIVHFLRQSLASRQGVHRDGWGSFQEHRVDR